MEGGRGKGNRVGMDSREGREDMVTLEGELGKG